MAFRLPSRAGSTSRSVRTEVTVRQHQRSVLFSTPNPNPAQSPNQPLLDTCPLCGNPLFPITPHCSSDNPPTFAPDQAHPLGLCPGPANQTTPVNPIPNPDPNNPKDQPHDPPQRGDSRRLR